MSAAARAEASIYDPQVALEFFKAAGKPEKVADGRTIFAEKEKSFFSRNKVYLLLSGEVGLLAGKKPIGTVKAGEIFGELAAITDSPRSATAVAKSACESASKRLCTRDEWVLACKGQAGTKFPYGDSFDRAKCNVWGYVHPGVALHQGATFGHL